MVPDSMGARQVFECFPRCFSFYYAQRHRALDTEPLKVIRIRRYHTSRLLQPLFAQIHLPAFG